MIGFEGSERDLGWRNELIHVDIRTALGDIKMLMN